MQQDISQRESRLRNEFAAQLAISEAAVQQQLQSLQEQVAEFQEQSTQSIQIVQRRLDQGVQALQGAFDDLVQQQRQQQILVK